MGARIMPEQSNRSLFAKMYTAVSFTRKISLLHESPHPSEDQQDQIDLLLSIEIQLSWIVAS